MLTVLSVCSGLDAAYAAWKKRGWKAVVFAEIEPFPCAVLHHHHGCGAPEAMPSPLCAKTAREASKLEAMRAANVKLPPRKKDAPVNAGDLRQLDGRRFKDMIDVMVGGTPCQSFSVAGLRMGLQDDRGNLSLEYVRVADECGARCVVWENVLGVLSDEGNAFGCFLSALAGGDSPAEPGPRPSLGKSSKFWKWAGKRGRHVPKWPAAGWVAGPKRTVAWRVFDAQYFGLAQRRKRVIVVGCACDGPDPREILFESGGVRRDSPPRRQTPQDLAGTLEGSLGRSRGAGTPPASLCPTLRAGGNGTGGHRPPGTDVDTVESLQVTQALTGRLGGGGPDDNKAQGGFYVAVHGSQDPDVVTDLAHTLGVNQGRENCVMAFGGECSRERQISTALGAHDRRTWEQDTFIAYPLRAQSQSAHDESLETYVAHALRAEGFDASEDGTGRGTPLVAAIAIRGRGGDCQIEMREDGLANTVLTPGGGRGGAGAGAVLYEAGVRRLIPVECERLQGLGDDYTLIPWGKKSAEECPDGPRYRAIGNAMPEKLMEWIGERLERALTASWPEVFLPYMDTGSGMDWEPLRVPPGTPMVVDQNARKAGWCRNCPLASYAHILIATDRPHSYAKLCPRPFLERGLIDFDRHMASGGCGAKGSDYAKAAALCGLSAPKESKHLHPAERCKTCPVWEVTCEPQRLGPCYEAMQETKMLEDAV